MISIRGKGFPFKRASKTWEEGGWLACPRSSQEVATPFGGMCMWCLQNFQTFFPLIYTTEFTQSPILQGSAKSWSPGLTNFVTADAYHFCLALPAAFTQPEDHILAEPCIRTGGSPPLPYKRHLWTVPCADRRERETASPSDVNVRYFARSAKNLRANKLDPQVEKGKPHNSLGFPCCMIHERPRSVGVEDKELPSCFLSSILFMSLIISLRCLLSCCD